MSAGIEVDGKDVPCLWCGCAPDHEPKEDCDPRDVKAHVQELRDEARMAEAGL